MFVNNKWPIAAMLLMMGTHAQAANFGGPDSVDNTIANQKKQQLSWREQLASNGVSFGADYIAVGFSSANGSQGNNVDTSGGVARFYGQWDLVGRESGNIGGFVWKIEHRHAYSDYPPKELGFLADLGGVKV
jgi:porin